MVEMERKGRVGKGLKKRTDEKKKSEKQGEM